MTTSTSQIHTQPNGLQRLKGLLSLILVALTGCFGPPAMHYDIEAYNRASVDSEVDMLLYNLGRLNHRQAPHFMMLSEVDQTRAFSTTAGFQWTDLVNSLLYLFYPARIVGTGTTAVQRSVSTPLNGSTTYQTIFGAASSENPTFKFNPIQGEDFAKRFESPLVDKFTYFLEERRWQEENRTQYVERTIKPFVLLFAQAVRVVHGDAICPSGIYPNVALKPGANPEDNTFWKCVSEYNGKLVFVTLEGGEKLAVTTSATAMTLTPGDALSALKQGYQWEERKNGGGLVLAKRLQMPAYLNFDVGKLTQDTSASSVKQKTPEESNLPYADEIIREAEPFPQDYVYFELRSGATSDIAQRACFPGNKDERAKYKDAKGVLCGYLKIGDLISIMNRLAENACRPPANAPADFDCAAFPNSVIGIGRKVPSWADGSVKMNNEEYVWVPAHSPSVLYYDKTASTNEPDRPRGAGSRHVYDAI